MRSIGIYHEVTRNLRKMNGKVYTLVLAVVVSYAPSCECEAPLGYLEGPYQVVNQFGQTGGSFGFTGPATFSATGFTPSKFYLPKKAYIQPKIYQVPVSKYSLQTTGYGDGYHHEPAHYEFHYNVHDHHHGTEFGHKEYRDGHVAKGQYVVLLPDGRRQIVDYVADANGYRPTIRYEGGFGYR